MPGNKKTFPPEFKIKSRLHYYSTLFNSIEVNSSFYRIPQRSTCEKWSADTPADFEFTLKLPKSVTHTKELDFDPVFLEKFFHSIQGIGTKKGCLLIQFPAKINLDYFTKVENLFELIRNNDPGNDWKIAAEFRHESWYVRETTELLNEYKAAIVIHDHAKGRNSSFITNADFLYLRFHGPIGNYRDSYSIDLLNRKAGLLKEFVDFGKDVYVYFNNTAGDAFENAKYLQSKLG